MQKSKCGLLAYRWLCILLNAFELATFLWQLVYSLSQTHKHLSLFFASFLSLVNLKGLQNIVVKCDNYTIYGIQSRHTLFANGLNQVPRGFKVSCPVIVNMIIFVNIITSLSEKNTQYSIQSSTLGYFRFQSCVFQSARGRWFEHTNGKCQLCTLQSINKPLCNIGMHLITILNILMPRYGYVHQHMPQNRVSDTITHMILNTINGVEHVTYNVPCYCCSGNLDSNHALLKGIRSVFMCDSQLGNHFLFAFMNSMIFLKILGFQNSICG